ncbi:hypothetical protein N658DRAFT_519777 [Parathielavia hyrcaniae]|uniref:Uncharacterized protein n=1 Tax=Parathielavia hyrcaniae TaxID=113614 RepID=A0AAN6T6S7_9PEZI|nr:hypothetical protein N658DRAFT_519777 [Parathielavia hyrcaniae]
MATFTLARTTTRRLPTVSLRHAALPVGVGLTTGLVAAQRPMQFDSVPAAATAAASQTRSLASGRDPKRDKDNKELLDAETIKQFSGGSLSGFVAGLLVSVFSKTLVLLAGIGMVIIQVAARNGMDLVSYFKLKERASTSRILALLNRHTAFKLAFAISFALSAFMSF